MGATHEPRFMLGRHKKKCLIPLVFPIFEAPQLPSDELGSAKTCEKGLVQVNSEMIGIKSWVNKDYTIQFNIKSWKGKAPNK